MTKSMIALCCAAFVCVSCATTGGPSAASSDNSVRTISRSESDAPVGYTLKTNSVLFEFRPSDYQWVTNGTTGKWVDISAIPIRRVTIAGDFNQWHPGNVQMIFDGRMYYLPVSLSVFEPGRAYGFKYVINGEWWVEPPSKTGNAASTSLENSGANLILRIE